MPTYIICSTKTNWYLLETLIKQATLFAVIVEKVIALV